MAESHTQCLLRRGNAQQVTWLPTKFANQGKYVKLRKRGSEVWDDGWLVAEVWTKLDSDYVSERSQDHKHLASLERERKRKEKK